MLIEENPSGIKRVGRILALKCPRCGYAKVFSRAKFPLMRAEMKQICEHCGYKFAEQEEGYFRGAVYLSYGMTLLEGLLAAMLAKVFIFGLSDRDLILIALCAMFFCSAWNYKMARVLWLNIQGEKFV
jgi:hypothetical protein